MNQFIKYSLALVFVLCLAVVCVAEEETKSASDFNFNNVMQGAWSVEVSEINIGEASTEEELFPVVGLYNFTHSALHDGILVGTYTQQGSEEDASDIEYKLFAQTEAEQAGSLKMIKRKKEESEEEEEVAETREGDQVVFEIPFNFVTHKPQPNQQTPVVHASSQGRFTAGATRKGTYQFLFTTREQFILTLIYDGENKMERIVGVKSVNNELSFFQKYGSTIMISVFFIGSRLLTRNLAPQGQQAPAAAATN